MTGDATHVKHESPILFKTAEEFRGRPRFIARLECEHADLDRIIGKYEFEKKDWIECGLMECTQKHGEGYVIRTKDGREGNCGNGCGGREFDVVFKEIKATYKKQVKLQLQQEMFDQFLLAKDKRIAEASILYDKVCKACSRITKVINKIETDPAITAAFHLCVRDGGLIRGAIEVDKNIHQGRGNLETKGKIEAINVIGDYKDFPSVINCKVVVALKNMNIADVNRLNENNIEKKLLELSKIDQLILLATKFLDDEAIFSSKINLKQFSHLDCKIPRRDSTTRTKRILEKLPTIFDV